MLNSIWCWMMLVSIAAAVATGRVPELTAAMGEGAQEAITLAVSMLGMMCLWTGLMRVAEEAGMTNILAQLFAPVIRSLFPEYKNDEQIKRHIAMNFSANLLGIGNAATPIGLTAVKEMAKRGEKQPSPGMMLFIVINTASLQLIPTYAVTLRGNYGSADPYDILPCIWIVSLSSLLVCVAACKLFEARRYHG